MRQRSERAGTGTGRRLSFDRSRRSSNLDSTIKSRQLEALLRVLPASAFVASSEGHLRVLSPPDDRGQSSAPSIISAHLTDTGLPEAAQRTILAGITRALNSDKTIRFTYELTGKEKKHAFDVRMTAMSENEVLGLVCEGSPERSSITSLESGQRPSTFTAPAKRVPLQGALQLVEQERRAFRHQISQELAQAVMPIVKRMKDRARPSELREAQFLEAQLNAILALEVDPFWDRYSALTPREMELCELLKGGLSSKQISQQLSVSLATVHKHREQIRRKLGFQHKRVNLSSYLKLHALPLST